MQTNNALLLILKAADFAARKHRDQRRKDARSSPYINHPVSVARILAETGDVRDPEILAGAILHDTIEDTDTSPGELETSFGSRIREYVEEVTDDKSLPREERKKLQIEHAPGLSKGGAQIKLADKISNVQDVLDDPPSGWSEKRKREYLQWAENVVSACPRVNPALEQRFTELLHRGISRLSGRTK